MMYEQRTAIIIAVPEYKDISWQPLPYVDGDVDGEKGLTQVLCNSLGQMCSFTKVLRAPAKATNTFIKKLLWENCVGEEIDNRKLVLVYFSGHGTLHPVTNSPCLVVHSSTEEDPDSTGIPFTWLVELFSNSKATLVLVMDACFSGNIAANRAIKELTDLKAKALFASCSENQESFAAKDGSQSLFTQTFIRGLLGSAGSEGKVTTSTMRNFLNRELKDGKQRPLCLVPKKPILLSVPGRPTPASLYFQPGELDKILVELIKKKRNELLAQPIFSDSGYFVRPSVTAFSILSSNPKSSGAQFQNRDVENNFKKMPLKSMLEKDVEVPQWIKESHWKNLEKEEQLLKAEDALDLLSIWRKSQEPLLLVFGDTGTGKSTVLDKLWLEAAADWLEEEKNYIPILIDLRIFADVRLHGRSARPGRTKLEEAERKFRAVLCDFLQYELGFPLLWENLLSLCKSHGILFFLDGLDEMSQDGRPESLLTHLQLIKTLTENGGRIVLTCRTHYLRSDVELFRALSEANLPLLKAMLVELQPFNSQQIEQFVARRLNTKAIRLWERFKQSGTLGLSELTKRPFLLDILTKVLNEHKDENSTPKQSSLFNRYLKEWLVRDRWRFEQFIEDFRDSIERDLKSAIGFDLLPKKDRQKDIVGWSDELVTHFIEAIAVELELSGGLQISQSEIVDFLRSRLPALPDIFLVFFDYAIRTCTFLTRDEIGNYKFLHTSIKDFFTASGIKREITRQKYSWDESLNRGAPEIKAVPESLGKKPLSKDVRAFLAEMFVRGQSTIFMEHIRSNKNRVLLSPNTMKYLCGNCLTLLSLLQGKVLKGDFKHMDLSGANLEGVTLIDLHIEGSVFEQAVFKETIFQDVWLEGTKFVQSDFTGATLSGAKVNGGTYIDRCSGLTEVRDKPAEFRKAESLSAKGERVYQPQQIEGLTKMVILKGDTFAAGISKLRAEWADSWETPAHKVEVSSFAIDIHPVTNSQFKKFVDANPEWGKLAGIDRLRNAYYLKKWSDSNDIPEDENGDNPVTYVNWFAANAYAEWAGKRLPTETEWEFALRDGFHSEERLYPWGNSPEDNMPPKLQNLLEQGHTVPWSETPRSEYGLYSMCGNVNEWVWDWYSEKWYVELERRARSKGSVLDPKGPDYGYQRVFRGGVISFRT